MYWQGQRVCDALFISLFLLGVAVQRTWMGGGGEGMMRERERWVLPHHVGLGFRV